MNEEENPNFYAIIPASVRYADITPNAKLLYGEITALCNKNGYCYATNEYFANLYNVSKVSISKWIRELVDNGFISSEIEYRGGTKQILNRYLRILYDPIKEKFNTPIKEKFKDNNTYMNNTYNNTFKNNIDTLFFDFWTKYIPVTCNGRFVAKGSKEAAYQKFIEELNSGIPYEDIDKGLQKYLKYCKDNKQLTCKAVEFLNQRRWLDDFDCKSKEVNDNKTKERRAWKSF